MKQGWALDVDTTKRESLSVIAKQARLENITADSLTRSITQGRKESNTYTTENERQKMKAPADSFQQDAAAHANVTREKSERPSTASILLVLAKRQAAMQSGMGRTAASAWRKMPGNGAGQSDGTGVQGGSRGEAIPQGKEKQSMEGQRFQWTMEVWGGAGSTGRIKTGGIGEGGIQGGTGLRGCFTHLECGRLKKARGKRAGCWNGHDADRHGTALSHQERLKA